ncbi:MAG TPA: choice-of-anchor tandem repeat GloVer-containing protein [Bacteroidia bacterium]|jgi:uncharacterized repeat protein (TIGR03803 family)|nr:choice-of-anchor tandem repeat GloVer-containing protein [Bacteroidia bacterium]
MKKKSLRYSFVILLFLFFANVKGQTIGHLYGMTPAGGGSAAGVLFDYNVQQAHDSVLYQFHVNPAQPMYNNLIHAFDGFLYGMTDYDNGSGYGTIFRTDTLGNVFVLHVFDDLSEGGSPEGSLIQAPDSLLYGMTYQGGTNGAGTIFKCTTSGLLTTLYSFTGTSDGGNPYGSLIIGKDGNLYGMNYQGGVGGAGTIFKCTITGVLTTLYSFTGASDGGNPYGSLIQDFDGNLYGMTYQGGASGAGTIFKCTTSGTLTTLYSFTGGADGQSPFGNLIQVNGKLYGMNSNGGTSGYGTLFKCDTLGNFNTLYGFTDGTDGGEPYGDLILASDGKLYGMTNNGGDSGSGTVFRCDTVGNLTTIYSFKGGADGLNPYASIVQLKNNLYGMTSAGGQYGNGNIFGCSLSGLEKNLFDMGAPIVNGTNPFGHIIQGFDGSYYGMNYHAGDSGAGVIFNYSYSKGMKALYSFDGTANGGNPYGSLVQAKDSSLYGMTSQGGTSGKGTLFKCSTSGVLTTLYSFTGGSDGGAPYGNLVLSNSGSFYGMTNNGGNSGDGTIFKSSASGLVTVLHTFSGTDGSQPFGSLIECTDGKLYGMTNNGGSNGHGVIFKCDTTGSYTVIYNFTGGNDGAAPNGSLIQAIDGNLYGMTSSAGAAGYGTIFKCDTSGSLATIYSFNNTGDGGTPYGSLIQGSDSNLYGMAISGGALNNGTVFKLNKSGIFDTLFSFNYLNGSGPQYNDLYEGMSLPVLTPVLSCSGYAIAATDAGGGLGALKYVWSNGATTSNIDSITSGGTFTCTITNSKGVSLSASVIVPSYTVLNVSLNMTNSTMLCTGGAAVTLSGGSPGGGSYSGTDVSGGQFNPVASGTFPITYTYTNGSGCTDSARQNISVSICTGTREQASNNDLSVYPNPSSGSFAVTFYGNGYQSMTIYDETGKQILFNKLDENISGNTLSVDMTMYAKGIYYGRIITSKGCEFRKIVLQ